MKRTVLKGLAAGVLLATVTSIAGAQAIDAAITRATGDLVADQTGGGSWGEFGFTGEAVAGLAQAYELTATAGYKTAADNGGVYCLYNEGGYNSGTGTYASPGLFAGGAYGLTRLSDISTTPANNPWRTAVGDFYTQVRTDAGTQNYIDDYLDDSNSEDSSAVYDIARHTVSAFYVGATDQGTWRSGLITALADIDDSDNSPVMALGAAVWGLAQTGDMDGTVVSTNPASTFHNVTLSQLPGMLVGHQAYDGSFYTKFDHSLGSGFTETTAMGALGLIAANGNDPSLYSDEILDAQLVLAGGVDTGGDVYWKIRDNGYPRYYFAAGETLEVIAEPAPLPGDANGNGFVDHTDLAILLGNWEQDPLIISTWELGNFTHNLGDGDVDNADLAILLGNWTGPPPPAGAAVPVPEPGTLCLLAAGGIACLRRRRT